ncbi:hypothetical protein [Streptomyces sp. NPDC054849]
MAYVVGSVLSSRSTAAAACASAGRPSLNAKTAAGAEPGGPAFVYVDQWGNLGSRRLSPDGVGRAMARAARYAGALLNTVIAAYSGRIGAASSPESCVASFG